MKKKLSVWRERAMTISFLVIVLLLWQFLPKSPLVPTPIEVISAFFLLLGKLETWQNIGNTALRVYLSLFVVIILGVSFGVSGFFNKKLSKIIDVVMQPIQFIASAVISILAIVVFGLSFIVPYFVITVAILPNTYIATQLGLKELKKKHYEFGKIYTKSRYKIFKYLILPQLIPYILIGAIRANAVAWKIAVTAEVFVAVDGLGFMVNDYYRRLNSPKLFATVLIIILAGLFFDQLIKLIRSKVFVSYDTIDINKKFK